MVQTDFWIDDNKNGTKSFLKIPLVINERERENVWSIRQKLCNGFCKLSSYVNKMTAYLRKSVINGRVRQIL